MLLIHSLIKFNPYKVNNGNEHDAKIAAALVELWVQGSGTPRASRPGQVGAISKTKERQQRQIDTLNGEKTS